MYLEAVPKWLSGKSHCSCGGRIWIIKATGCFLSLSFFSISSFKGGWLKNILNPGHIPS
jgi:hypothetical protein